MLANDSCFSSVQVGEAKGKGFACRGRHSDGKKNKSGSGQSVVVRGDSSHLVLFSFFPSSSEHAGSPVGANGVDNGVGIDADT